MGGSRYFTLPQTKAEKTLLGISGDMWSTYEDLFMPIEDVWLDSIGKGGASAQEAENIMSAEAAHQFSPQERGAYQEAFAGGVNPNSGAFLGLAAEMAMRKAGTTTQAMNEARNLDTRDYINEALAASQYGRGIGSESITGIANEGSRKAIAQNMAFNQALGNDAAEQQTKNSLYNAAGTVAGIGLGYGASKYGGTLSDAASSFGDVVVQGVRGNNTLSGLGVGG